MTFPAEDLHCNYCRYFWTNLLFWCILDIFFEVILIALTSREQLFMERPLYKRFCIMITYPISSNLCKKIYLQCYRLYNFSFFRSSHWRCSVRKDVLQNFAKFTGKHLWQSLFFNKVTGWSDCFPSFLCLLLKFLAYFISTEKWNEKKGNTLLKFKYLLVCSSIDLIDVKDFKRIQTDGYLIKKCV